MYKNTFQIIKELIVYKGYIEIKNIKSKGKDSENTIVIKLEPVNDTSQHSPVSNEMQDIANNDSEDDSINLIKSKKREEKCFEFIKELKDLLI